MAETPKDGETQLIPADRLCLLTGLTDRRHRQLSAEGYFPGPMRGQYKLVPTLQGLFRYYREAASKLREQVLTTRDLKGQKEIELLDLKIARDRGAMIDRNVVETLLGAIATLQRSRLYSALEQELPGRVTGRDPAQVRVVGREIADELCAIFSDAKARWVEELQNARRTTPED